MNKQFFKKTLALRDRLLLAPVTNVIHRKKGLFWLRVSEVSEHGWKDLLLSAYDRIKHLGSSMYAVEEAYSPHS